MTRLTITRLTGFTLYRKIFLFVFNKYLALFISEEKILKIAIILVKSGVWIVAK